jgi:hypothetical protein
VVLFLPALLADTAPTNIQLSNDILIKGQAADTLIGTLSANDADTATLSFSVSDTTSFKIDGNKLKTKISIDTVGDMDINITADDGTNAPITQAFTIAVITNIPDITPVIKQFTITQLLECQHLYWQGQKQILYRH